MGEEDALGRGGQGFTRVNSGCPSRAVGFRGEAAAVVGGQTAAMSTRVNDQLEHRPFPRGNSAGRVNDQLVTVSLLSAGVTEG